MVLTEGSRVTDEDTGNVTEVDNLWSPLQRRQDLLDNRMNDRDTRLNGLDTRLNEVSARLNTRRNEVNTRFNRMDSRLDGIETAISDMKEFLQLRMDAMDKKLEWALTDINPRPKASTVLPDTKPQQDVTEIPREPVFPDPGCRTVYTGCQDALTHGMTNSGVYTITPVQGNSFNVFCEQLLEGGGWTVFQVRKDGSVNFFNDWNSYKVGFGELTGEFWLGNSKIHLLTNHQDMELLVELTSAEGEVERAKYTHFWINGEADMFRLSVRGYSSGSSSRDSLAHNNGRGFSTVDKDNDLDPLGSCTTLRQGAWWYGSCTNSNLNGLYGGEGGKGLSWEHWKGTDSMSATRMMMRRRS